MSTPISLEDIVSEDHLVTPSQRSARLWQQALDARARAAAQVAWRATTVLPLSTWLAAQWNAVRAHLAATQSLPSLLNPLQERALWERVIAESRATPALAAPASLAAGAAAAWALHQTWSCPRALLDASDIGEVAQYAVWQRAFAQALARNRWITGAELASALAKLYAEHANLLQPTLPKRIVTLPMLQTNPAWNALLAGFAELGCGHAVLSIGAPARALTQQRYLHAEDEWRAAALWARVHLLAHPSARVAVVVPALHAVRHQVARVFRHTLAPDALLEPLADTGAVFNLSLGVRLAEVPLVHSALCWLRSGGGLSTLDAASALDASFLQAPVPWLREAHEQGIVRMNFAALIRRVQPPARGQAFEASVRAWPRRALPSVWAQHIVQALTALGFPGAQVDSWNYQAATALIELIDSLRVLDAVLGELSARQFVQRLARHCTEADFQAEGRDAPVQILGLYESLGVRFDAMWVTGLSQNVLPEPVETTPYLPIVWQRASGAGRGNAAVMRSSAETIFAQWKCAADTVVFSAPTLQDEAAIAPCAMLDAQAWVSSAAPARVATTMAAMQHIPDAQGLPFSEAKFPGGVNTIAAQAGCGFQAYARYRLAAQPWPAQARGATARERGTLLHAAMAALWRQVGTQFAWLHASEAEREAWIDAAVDAGWANLQHAVDASGQRAWPAVLPQAIRTSLRHAVANWMVLEAQRAPFEVIGIEKKVDIQLGAYSLSGRIDRYDRLESQGVAVLDYKTGTLPAAKVLADAQSVGQYPQLPLYAMALASTESIEAVAWAGTKRGDAALKGAGMAEGLFASTSRAKKKPEVWQTMLSSWPSILTQHADAFGRGWAAVQPANPTVCTMCQRQALCRYAPEAEPDDAPQEDVDADA